MFSITVTKQAGKKEMQQLPMQFKWVTITRKILKLNIEI